MSSIEPARDPDARKPRADRDGVRVFESGGASRARFVVAATAVAAALVVVVTATAVVFLRGESGAQRTRDASTTWHGQLGGAQQAGATSAVVPVPTSGPRERASVPADRVATATPAVPTTNSRTDRRRRDVPMGNVPVPVDPATERAGAVAPDGGIGEQQQRQVASLARDFIAGLKARGETRGLAAFPPPGTVPIKTGIIVPDDFQLPEGYVRYHQVTDEGERLPPILMFSPDYQFVDRDGHPITLPKDGIVPPEMAPPGLPVRMLEQPKAAATTAGSHGDRG